MPDRKYKTETLDRHGIEMVKTTGGVFFSVKCSRCGGQILLTKLTENLAYKYVCDECKEASRQARRRKIEREKYENVSDILPDKSGDDTHRKRFYQAATKVMSGASDKGKYQRAIDIARTRMDKYDSVPEAIAAIMLLYHGFKIIPQQKVGDFNVDFAIPEHKIVLEIDGSIYHRKPDDIERRDYALRYMLGNDWKIKHIPAEAVSAKPRAFGKMISAYINR